MALRIGAPATDVTPIPEEVVPTEEELAAESVIGEAPEDIPSPLQEGKASIVAAGYKGSEMGPFLCANCQYFEEDNSCLLVSGYIDERGVCNLFTPIEMSGVATDPLNMPAEEVLPVEEEFEPEALQGEASELAVPVPDEYL